VDERSRPPTLLFIGAINESPQLAQIYQYLRDQPATLAAQISIWREGMKTFKELPSWVEIRGTWTKLLNWRAHSNRDNVGHAAFLVWSRSRPPVVVSGASAGFCIYLDPWALRRAPGRRAAVPDLPAPDLLVHARPHIAYRRGAAELRYTEPRVVSNQQEWEEAPSLRVVVCSQACLRSNALGRRESIEGARVAYIFLDVDKPPALLQGPLQGEAPFAAA